MKPIVFACRACRGQKGKTVIYELSVFAENRPFYDLVATIGIIIEEGMTDMLHVDANLVRTSRFQDALHQG